MNDSYSEWPNITTTDDYYDNDVRQIYPIMVVSLVLSSITCVLGIPGNAFIIWIVGVKMKKTVTTVWYVNLAVADLLCCLCMPLPMAINAVYLAGNIWAMGETMLKIFPVLLVSNMYASVFTLTLISLDRVTGVIWPVWARTHKTIFRARLLCGLVWFLALLLSLLSTPNYDINQCIVRAVFGFLPLLVITVCSLLIVVRLSFTRFKSQKSLLIMVGVVMAFFVCWTPYHVGCFLLFSLSGDVAQAMFHLSLSLAIINSCLNPVLYAFMGTEFKKSAKMSLRHIFENAFKEDVM